MRRFVNHVVAEADDPKVCRFKTWLLNQANVVKASFNTWGKRTFVVTWSVIRLRKTVL